MVADIQLLQGKIIDDPEKRTQNISLLIEELAREFVAIHTLSATAEAAEVVEHAESAPLAGTA